MNDEKMTKKRQKYERKKMVKGDKMTERKDDQKRRKMT